MAKRFEGITDSIENVPDFSYFDMSYNNRMTMDLGHLYISYVQEMFSNDEIKKSSDQVVKFAPLLAPVMDKLDLLNYHFYVKNRDIWPLFDNYITNGDSKQNWPTNMNFIAPEIPYFHFDVFLDHNFNNDFQVYSSTLRSHLSKYVYIMKLSNGDYVKGYSPSDANTTPPSTMLDDLTYTDPTDWLGTHMTVDDPSQFSKHGLLYRIPMGAFEIFDKGNCKLLDYIGIPLPTYQFDYQSLGSDICPQTTTAPSPTHLAAAVEYAFLGNINGVDTLKFYESYQTIKQRFLEYEKLTFRDDGDLLYDLFPNDDLYGDELEFYSMLFDFITKQKPYLTALESVIFRIGSTGNLGFLGQDYVESPNKIRNFINPDYHLKFTKAYSILPIMAYHYIYAWWFRDENLEECLYDFSSANGSITENGTLSGSNYQPLGYFFNNPSNDPNLAIYCLQHLFGLYDKSFEKDPYTTALPAPQRGADVPIITGKINVSLDSSTHSISSGEAKHTNLYFEGSNLVGGTGSATSGAVTVGNLQIDLSKLPSNTINSLRYMNSLQKYLEKKARVGNRIYEYYKAFFGKEVDELMLGIPKFLGGSRTPIGVSEVTQFSGSTDDTALGQLAGKMSTINSNDYVKFESDVEGHFFTLTCIMPRLSYSQGVTPHNMRGVRRDRDGNLIESYLQFPKADFANLGEEEVNVDEIFSTSIPSFDNRGFGYSTRYYNAKFRVDETHGDFKESLNYWTFTRNFGRQPNLSPAFIKPHFDYRQFAVVDDVDHAYMFCENKVTLRRPLPIHSIPSL